MNNDREKESYPLFALRSQKCNLTTIPYAQVLLLSSQHAGFMTTWNWEILKAPTSHIGRFTQTHRSEVRKSNKYSLQTKVQLELKSCLIKADVIIHW